MAHPEWLIAKIPWDAPCQAIRIYLPNHLRRHLEAILSQILREQVYIFIVELEQAPRMSPTILLDPLIWRRPRDLLFRLVAGTELGAWRRLRHQYYQQESKSCSHISFRKFYTDSDSLLEGLQHWRRGSPSLFAPFCFICNALEDLE
jgi:hypothetical protein